MYKDWAGSFNEKYLLNIGFELSGETNTYKHPHLKGVLLKVIPEDKVLKPSYSILVGDSLLEERKKINSPKDKLYQDFIKHFSYYLNIRFEDQIKVDILFNMSGMFIHGKIYDYMSQGSSVFKSWSGEDIDIAVAYDKYVKQVKRYLKSREKIDLVKDDKDEVLNAIRYSMSICNPFSKSEHGNFISFVKDWDYLEDLYKDIFRKGLLKKEFVAYGNFYREMVQMNRFFFPSHSGLQHGNPFASKRLLEKSLEIVNEEIDNTQKMYSEDGEIYDESCIY